ncbi:hypothetical protein KI387_036748, partial [Taxus chinensis]
TFIELLMVIKELKGIFKEVTPDQVLGIVEVTPGKVLKELEELKKLVDGVDVDFLEIFK